MEPRLDKMVMKRVSSVRVVLVTAPDLKTARRLARAALAARLIACANLVPRVESHYWWQGRIERGNEVLVLLKTSSARLPALERLILEQHPYDTAEFVALPVGAVTARYLAWWQEAIRPSPRRGVKRG